MKKVLLTIISVCLIAASIFGLFAGVSSFSDIMNVKEYKEEDAKEGLDAIKELNAGLDLLQENEGTYLAGVDTYTAGQIAYSEGKSQLSAATPPTTPARSSSRKAKLPTPPARSRLPTTPRLTMKARPPSPRSSL